MTYNSVLVEQPPLSLSLSPCAAASKWSHCMGQHNNRRIQLWPRNAACKKMREHHRSKSWCQSHLSRHAHLSNSDCQVWLSVRLGLLHKWHHLNHKALYLRCPQECIHILSGAATEQRKAFTAQVRLPGTRQEFRQASRVVAALSLQPESGEAFR